MNDLCENTKVLGDFHNGQATELIKEGEKVFIRKPKSASTEIAYKIFIEMLEKNGFLYVPGTVDIIRTDHNVHDVNITPHRQVESIEKVSDFYRRAGSMLFFIYIFSGADFHCENIIANGEFPTIVDYELLMSGQVNAGYKPTYNSLVDSVLGTHFLPNWKKTGKRFFEVSGLSGGPDKNVLFFQGKPTFAYNYIYDIIYGFKYAYEFSLDNSDLIKKGIKLFEKCAFRVIVRPTSTYIKVAKILSDLKAEEKRNNARALLSRAYEKNFDDDQRLKAVDMLEAEVVAVTQGEAPLFYVNGNGTDLFFSGKKVYVDYLKLSPVDNAINKLNSLTSGMIEDQINIIKQSIEAIKPISKKMHYEIDNRCLDRIIFETLESMSISFLPTGWLQLFEDKGCPYIDVVGTGLYDGMLGILCCYGALYNKTSEQEYLDTLLKRYQAYHEYGIPGRLDINNINVSLQEGVAGHILILQHLYELTGKEIFLYDSRRLLELISLGVKERGFPKVNLDILSGYASLTIAISRFQKE